MTAAFDADLLDIHVDLADGTERAHADALLRELTLPPWVQAERAYVSFQEDEDTGEPYGGLVLDLEVIADCTNDDYERFVASLRAMERVEHVEVMFGYSPDGYNSQRSIERRATPRHVAATPGRNDPCSCGSGIKFKRCCGQ